jgi:tRNA-Thr(GGU) m(6)t(6)A37 methyltransferase TsaA
VSEGNPGGVTFHPIGVIRSGHADPERTPIQPVFAEGCLGRAEILPQYAEGLCDLEGFSHVYLIYHLHRAAPSRLKITPFLEDSERGIFATRAPCRPNPIGLSVVRLLGREGQVLHLDGLDILDGTPLLDIKPYSGRFDRIETSRDGWQEGLEDAEARRRGRRETGRGRRARSGRGERPGARQDPPGGGAGSGR